jgi:hypothetical protein
VQTVLQIVRIIVGALIQSGLAYRSGRRAAEKAQRKSDLEAAANALDAKADAASADLLSRDDLIDQLRNKDRLRK